MKNLNNDEEKKMNKKEQMAIDCHIKYMTFLVTWALGTFLVMGL